MSEAVVSIVIPAHNEAAVIEENLRILLGDSAPGEFDVIVVPNACADETAAAARRAGVRVVETPVPGKVHAIGLADRECRTFPRIYLDADVRLTADSVRALVAACAEEGVLACAPAPEFDLNGTGFVMRRVHTVHDRLMAPTRALAGAGCYVLTEAGHARVFPMPEVLSDDGYVHNSFTPGERVVVRQARSFVRPARTVSAYLRRRVRVRAGNRQLAELGRVAAEGRLGPRALLSLVARREVRPLDAGCYLAVLLLDRGWTILRGRRGGTTWGLDLSSRVHPGTGNG